MVQPGSTLIALDPVRSDFQILFHGHLGEERPAFGRITDAQSGPLMHRQVCEITVSQNDLARGGSKLAHNDSEQRCLPCPICTHNRYCLFLTDAQTDRSHNSLLMIPTRYGPQV